MFYKTQRYADEGRLWFDELADAAVVFRTREISDPKGRWAGLGNRQASTPSLPGTHRISILTPSPM